MAAGAYSQDVLTRIFNVQWEGGGTVFIYGEWLGNLLHYVSMEDADSEPERQTISLPEPPDRDLTTRGHSYFGVVGSAYADVGTEDLSEPKFLICGTRTVPHEIDDGIGNMVTVIDSYALIYASDDGVTWRVAREQPEVIDDFAFQHRVATNAMVFDPDTKSFYYDQHYIEFHPHTGLGSKSTDQMFKSAKGAVWGKVSDTETGSDPGYVSDFPKSYCKHNDCLDGRNQHVPDGVMFTDTTTPTAPPPDDEAPETRTVKPTIPPLVTYNTGGVSYTPGKNTVEVKRAKDDGSGVELSRVVIPGIGCVTCVAGVNGIFMAGGFVSADDTESAGAVAISIDGGVTWEPFATTQNGVTTMIAGTLAPPSPSPARRNARL